MSNPVGYNPQEQKTWFKKEVVFSYPVEFGSVVFGYVAKTANYTVGVDDYTIDCTSGTFTVTLPTAVGIEGKVYNIKNSGTGLITIATTSSQTIDGYSSLDITLSRYDSLLVQSNGANWIIL